MTLGVLIIILLAITTDIAASWVNPWNTKSVNPNRKIDDGTFSGSFAMCLVVKNENHLGEWVEYHKRMGCSKFYIYDNNSTIALPHTFDKYIEENLIEVRNVSDEHGTQKQIMVYKNCLREFGSRHDFMGFIDSDEFIVIKNSSLTIPDVLQSYNDYGALTLNWMLFGSSGHVKRPLGGLIANYHKCFTNYHVKSLVNLAYVNSDSISNPHSFSYKNNKYSVDIRKNRVDASFNPPDPKSAIPAYLFEEMYINHYYCKSFEEYKHLLEHRGSVSGKKSIRGFIDFDKKAINNCTILQMPPESRN